MAEGRANPPVSIATTETQSERRVTLGVYHDMSDIQAKTMTNIAKYTHTIPARHETYRSYGPLILAAVLLYFLIPPFLAAEAAKPDTTTLAYVIVAIVAIAAAAPVAKAIVKAVKGNE
jgi:hypothetical protein